MIKGIDEGRNNLAGCEEETSCFLDVRLDSSVRLSPVVPDTRARCAH